MKGKHFETRSRGWIRGVIAAAILSTFAGRSDALEKDGELRAAFEKGLGEHEGELLIDEFGANILLIGRTGEGKDPIALECLLCNGPETVAAAREVGALLSKKRGGEAPAHLVILASEDQVPTAATIDATSGRLGERGQTLEPGPHEVEVRTADDTARREIELRPGERRVLNLREELGSSEDSSFRPPSLVTGLGLALAAFSIPFLALDGGCASGDQDIHGDCKELHDTSTLGWSLLGTGTAVALAGVITLIAMKVKQGKARREREVSR